MMRRGRRYRVGLLVVAAGVLFLGLLSFVLGKGLGAARVGYFILFEENVKGMAIGSKVNFQGVPMGSVRDIRFQDGRTLVELAVDPSRGVIQDVTRARLDRLLVTGQVTVELEGYEKTARRLPPGSLIAPTADPLHQLTRTLPEALDEVIGVLHSLRGSAERLDVLLADERLPRMMGNLDRVAALLPVRIERSADGVDAVLAAAAAAARSVDAATTAVAALAAGPEAQGLLVDARLVLHGLLQTRQRLEGLFSEADGLLRGLRAPATASVHSLRSALDEARGLLRVLRLAPDSVIYGVDRPAEPPAAPGGTR